jgi:predicted secreted protein
MSPLVGAALYFILWWLCFFIALPIGVRNLDEAGLGDSNGLERGAPAQPMLLKKALWALGGAAVLWVILLLVLNATFYNR